MPSIVPRLFVSRNAECKKKHKFLTESKTNILCRINRVSVNIWWQLTFKKIKKFKKKISWEERSYLIREVSNVNLVFEESSNDQMTLTKKKSFLVSISINFKISSILCLSSPILSRLTEQQKYSIGVNFFVFKSLPNLQYLDTN